MTLLGELLGRPPAVAEAVLFGILWSEHCSYKSTRHLLKRLPTEAPQVMIGPGEDAGVVVAARAVRGHRAGAGAREPQSSEPGAAGRGRGHRRRRHRARRRAAWAPRWWACWTRCASAIPRGAVHVRDVMRGVVQGIAAYGNALGVPNLGGDMVFDAGFDHNCLVNVMAVGLAPADGMLRSRVPEGPGPWVFVLVGKPTDESGFGGAAFASGELGDGDQRGAVQLPDPFLKRVLHVANVRGVPPHPRARHPVRLQGPGRGRRRLRDERAGGRGRARRDDRARARCTASTATLPPEVLLCAETQERFCWVVPPRRSRRNCCELYNREFALDRVHPGAGRARDRPGARAERRYRVTWNGELLVDCDGGRDHRRAAAIDAARPRAAVRPRAGARRARRARDTARIAAARCCGATTWARASTSSATTTPRCRAARGCGPAKAMPR